MVLWWARNPLWALLVEELLTSIHSGYLLAANNSSPSLGLLSKLHIPAPSPCVCWWTGVLGWGSWGCGTDHLCHSVLPATGGLLGFLWAEAALCPSWSPCWWGGFPRCRTCSSPSAPCQGCRSHSTSSPLPFTLFFSFILPSYMGIFLVHLVVQGLLLVFNRCC